MTSSTPRTRIALGPWLVTYAAKVALSPKLKPLYHPFSTRKIAKPDEVMVPTRHGKVRCFLYRPHPAAPLATGGVTPPVHINIHGGGFIFTNALQDDHIARYIAAEVGAFVVSIDYSTAPQVLFPVAEEQCFNVLQWVADRGAVAHGWDSSRISVGGGSAGAKLALNTLQLAHRNDGPSIKAAALIVPFVDATLPPESYTSPLEKPVISPFAMKLILGAYFADVARRSDPLASPALDPDLAAALPPTVVLTGQYDTLRTQGQALVARLTEQGAPISHREFAECDHDWIASAKTPIAVVQESLDLITQHLLDHLTASGSSESSGPQPE